MTISLAWVRRNKDAVELVVASDSRLRSRGALNQAQKIIRLERGDCALSFCGDAQVAYPLFMQAGSTLNNFIKTRSRATDLNVLSHIFSELLNALVGSWDLAANEKAEELESTRIVLTGWSARSQEFRLGLFEYENGEFVFKRARTKIPHPWYEKERSFLFVGDYERQYLDELAAVLAEKHGVSERRDEKRFVDLEYEPLVALQRLLARTGAEHEFSAIGGAPQMLKIYPFSQSLPFVVRTAPDAHYLFGRKLFEWEKTEYPVIDLTGEQLRFLYPMSEIPLPADLQDGEEEEIGTEPLPAEPGIATE
nr:hypothetical protein [Brevundimonas diminuta]